jgi:hypothetical protein
MSKIGAVYGFRTAWFVTSEIGNRTIRNRAETPGEPNDCWGGCMLRAQHVPFSQGAVMNGRFSMMARIAAAAALAAGVGVGGLAIPDRVGSRSGCDDQ